MYTKMAKKKFFITLLLINLFFWNAAKAEPVGSITLQSGKIIVHGEEKDSTYVELNKSIALNRGDRIRSGPSTRAKITLKGNKDQIELYSNAFLSLDQFNEERTELSLLVGKARFIIASIVNRIRKGRRRFHVRTSNAVIGVKGTDFVVQIVGESTSVLTLEGVVSMANLADPEVEIEISKNQASQTTQSQPPAPPIQVSPEAQKSILSQNKAQTWEGVKFEEPIKEEGREEKEKGAFTEEKEGRDLGEVIDKLYKFNKDLGPTKDAVKDAASNRSIELIIIEK